jgi:hypothetical protein
MSAPRFAAAVAAAGLLCLPSSAQGLVVSTALDVAVPTGFALQEELHRLEGGGRRVELPFELLATYVGDADGDGIFDDAPTDLDAAHWTGAAGPGAFLLSTTANFTAAGGVQLLDGDVFQFTTTGVQIVYAESFFQNATGTTAVDVDAFAVGPAGELYFSFAEDETTSNAALIAANGGAALLDEQCVFRLDVGAATAALHLNPAAVVAVFNAAYGATATTTVDVDGVELDPFHPGELLLTCASSSSALKGKVVSTHGGGQPFFVGGREAAPVGFDFATPTSLDALAWVGAAAAPVLRAAQQNHSVNSATAPMFWVEGWQPGEPVQFAFTDAAMPRAAFTAPVGFGGFGWTPLDLQSPLLVATMTSSALLTSANAFGIASVAFSPFGLPPYVYPAVQAVGLWSGALSTPVVLSFLP